MKWNEILERIDMPALRRIEREVRPEYSEYGLEPELTGRHFVDRVNDPRNEPPINDVELADFMKQSSKPPAVVKLASKTPGEEVLVTGPSSTDPKTILNVPFIVSKDPRNPKKRELVAKTIMRKTDFKSDNRSSQERISSSMTPEQLKKMELLRKAGLAK